MHTDPIQPYFDMELFLHAAQETRLNGDDLEECLRLWQEWSALLHARTVRAESRTYLALWLDEAVEKAADAAWDESPSRGFRLNALAQTLVMTAVHELVPEVEDAGCAPVPRASRNLATAVAEAGLACRPGEPGPCGAAGVSLQLGRRYAVVTPKPFRGGCEICALQRACPRAGGDGSVIELPGPA